MRMNADVSYWQTCYTFILMIICLHFSIEKIKNLPAAKGINGEILDFNTLLTIKRQKIGIVSAGDVAVDLEREINYFIGIEVEIIICCTRSRNVRGSSYRMIIDKFSKKNQIIKEVWVNYSQDISDKETIKKQQVSEIVKIISNEVRTN